ncbi:MAG: hypothetical protein HPY78_10235 [Brevinematales bacterium]|nr:hypothetical protein [Brevinematales bacterium]
MWSFFERWGEMWENRDAIVYFLFGDLFIFLEEHGISRVWVIWLLVMLMNTVGFLFETGPRFTGKKLTLRERWKFFWRDFDVVKTLVFIVIIFAGVPLGVAAIQLYGYMMIIPPSIVFCLLMVHFFLSTEKYIDKSQKFSFENFKRRWKMYWKGFDLFRGGICLLGPIGMFCFAILHQVILLRDGGF